MAATADAECAMASESSRYLAIRWRPAEVRRRPRCNDDCVPSILFEPRDPTARAVARKYYLDGREPSRRASRKCVHHMGRNGPRHDGGPFALDAERDEPHGASGLRVGEFVLQSHASGICRRDVCATTDPMGSCGSSDSWSTRGMAGQVQASPSHVECRDAGSDRSWCRYDDHKRTRCH